MAAIWLSLPESRTAVELRLPSKIWALMGPVLQESGDDRSGANYQRGIERLVELLPRMTSLLIGD